MNTEGSFEKDLASIHQLMERSVKFVSLSGLSGILAGTFALAGAAAAYYLVYYPDSLFDANYFPVTDMDTALKLVGIGLTVLIASVTTGLWMSARKARRHQVSIWDAAARRLIINLLIPLIAGGTFCIISLWQGHYDIVASATLIFYGLALVNASPHLFDEVRYLGLCEIAVGLISMLTPGFSLLYWAFGFGILHILYGAILYRKYQ